MSDDLFQPVKWIGDAESGYVWMLDQRLLPTEEVALCLEDHGAVADSIRDLVVRGAPAIGVSAAMGVVLAGREALALPDDQQDTYWRAALDRLAATRPTAVNLFWALRRMEAVFEKARQQPREAVLQTLLKEALVIQDDDTKANLAMGAYGAELLEPGSTVLTHCNAGALATSAYGTALGIVRAGYDTGKVVRVFADETRPYLQGARLTAWELKKDGIPVTLITDNMAGHMMKQGEIDAVVVGSDRIAANGDVANKIGTYAVAILARYHGIPFYVAAPTSTIDLDAETGEQIPIEERSDREVTHIKGHAIAPDGIDVRHPAFDVTPAELVTAIITELGVASPPTTDSVLKIARPIST